ncbi:MAG: hypothetical protein EOP10_02365 [Proteobacteria bacterium]|nr:MAG: hypothetical protein EOP10_02365 [Pseudomonadota bacterium]
MSRISLALAASILLMSCKDDDKATAFTGTTKVTANSVSPPANLPALTAADAKEHLSSLGSSPIDQVSLTSLLLQSSGQEDEEDPATGGPGEEDPATGDSDKPVSDPDPIGTGPSNICFETQVEDLKLKAVGDTISVDSSVDIGSCLATYYKNLGASEVKIEKAAYGFYFETSCAGGDYSAANGKNLKDAEAIFDSDCKSTISNLSSTVFTLKGSITVQGQVIKFDNESTTAISKADGTPCTITLANGVRTENGCVEVTRTVNAIDPAENFFQKSTSNNLTWTEATPGNYFESGSLSVVVNNWKGTITYSGASTPPTYSITDGTSTETGTLVY